MSIVIFLSFGRQIERPMCSQCLTHLEVSQSRVRELYNTLRVGTPYRDFWVLNQMLDVGDDILGEDGYVGRGDYSHDHELHED